MVVHFNHIEVSQSYICLQSNNSMSITNKGKVNSIASAVAASCYRQITWETVPVKYLDNEFPRD